jgi:hypothetical protein
MIIGPNFIFIHTPKCAGSSFCKMMLERHGLKETGDPHSTARDIPMELRESHYIFGFMRDPVKQAVSNFVYHTRSWKEKFDKEMTFEDWCEWRWGEKEQGWASKWIHDPHCLKYGYHMNVRPSAGFFCDENGKCIADHIYRFEDMKESTQNISDKLEIDCDLSNYHVLTIKKNANVKPKVTDRCVELLKSAKLIDFILHGKPGEIKTNYSSPTVPGYAYAQFN